MPRLFVLLIAAVAAGDLSLGAASLRYLPASTPVHWNWRGEVDRYGSPWEVAFAMPAVIVVLGGVLMLVAQLPMKATSKWPDWGQARYRRMLGMFSVATLVTFAAIHCAMILLALGWPVRIERVVLFMLAMLMLWISFEIAKLPRNPIVGIRTPWTLASDDVWRRTHRFGGRLFVAYGLAILLAALVGRAWIGFAVLVGGALALVIWSLVYSHRLYRRTM